MNILIIEDDRNLALELQSILQSEGFTAYTSYDGADGLNKLMEGKYDLALLDLNIPKLDGFSVLNAASRRNIKIPIIILTARSDIEDKLRGLSSGAVDYITKPFDSRELVARIRLRIGTVNLRNKYRVGNLCLDTDSYELVCGDSSIPLTKKEYLIFEHLLLNAGIIQKREVLIAKLWDDEPIDDRTLDVYISMIRKKMESLGSTAIITTKRSVGYVLEDSKKDS